MEQGQLLPQSQQRPGEAVSPICQKSSLCTGTQSYRIYLLQAITQQATEWHINAGNKEEEPKAPQTQRQTPIAVLEQKCCAVLDSCGAKDVSGIATPQVQLSSWQEPGVQPQHVKACLTQTDKNSLQGLIGGCLQVEE